MGRSLRPIWRTVDLRFHRPNICDFTRVARTRAAQICQQMIGLVEHVNHGPTAIHRIFISEDGSALPAAPCDWPRRAGGNGSAPSAFDPLRKFGPGVQLSEALFWTGVRPC
jgi:hypothetical protein